MPRVALPSFVDYFYPTLQALQVRSGRTSIAQLESDVAKWMSLPRAVLDAPHGNSNQTEFQYRLAWVRTCLKKYGAVRNPGYGVWEITPEGLNISERQAREIYSGLYPPGRRR